MGFFDLLMDAFKDDGERADGTKGAKSEERPMMPNDMREHLRDDCVQVRGTIYHSDVLDSIESDTLEVKIRKAPASSHYDYVVRTLDDVEVGGLRAQAFRQSGAKTRGTTTAEVIHPVWMLTERTELYIPMTEDAKAERERAKEMTLWMTVDGSKWEVPTDAERLDYLDAEFALTSQGAGKKPVVSVIADGMRLFRVTPRMKYYAAMVERSDHIIRRLIAERKEGANGTFWRVGLYF